jgi:hypothetical protein
VASGSSRARAECARAVSGFCVRSIFMARGFDAWPWTLVPKPCVSIAERAGHLRLRITGARADSENCVPLTRSVREDLMPNRARTTIVELSSPSGAVKRLRRRSYAANQGCIRDSGPVHFRVFDMSADIRRETARCARTALTLCPRHVEIGYGQWRGA